MYTLVSLGSVSRVKDHTKQKQSKYNTVGFSNEGVFETLNVHSKYTKILSGATNMALAENTKSQYRTAVKHIERIQTDLNIDMSLPFTIGKTLNYVGYLLDDRSCSSKTVAQYLSGVRMLHLCNGMDVAALRPPIINLILKGREHWENIQETLKNKPKRVPVTISVMKYLKRILTETKMNDEKKIRLWLICCLLWNGSLRVHELLSRNRDSFDPITTLRCEDIELVSFFDGGVKKSLLRIHLKSPKERRVGTGVKLEIFSNGTFCCPIRAWGKWSKMVTLEPGLPLFREGPKYFTGRDFNKLLTGLTKDITDGTDGVIKPHSFRSGVATEMGLRGFSDSEIQQQGRWTSQAFKAYLKLDRVKRLKFTERLSEMLKD